MARAEEDAPPTFTAAQALKLGVEKMAEKINGGEAGEDQAALIYATAKRLETENALAQKNLALVVELNHWRESLGTMIDQMCGLAYTLNGGGTMYSHASSRNNVGLEKFLAELSKQLPFGEGKGDEQATEKLKKLGSFISKLTIDADLEKEIDPSMLNGFKEDKANLVKEIDQLQASFSYLPGPAAKGIASFLVKNASWLEYPGAEQETKAKAK